MTKQEMYDIRFEHLIKKAENLRDFVKASVQKAEKGLEDYLQLLEKEKQEDQKNNNRK